jgi:hypothetical protein
MCSCMSASCGFLRQGILLIMQVGDYVLSPDMCIERKAIPDLRQSLASGRLFHQVGCCLGIPRGFCRPAATTCCNGSA